MMTGGQAQKQGTHLETTEGVRLETMVPWAPGILVTAERKTWICDQFRNRTETICQWILFNWKEESDILPRFVTYETGWPY